VSRGLRTLSLANAIALPAATTPLLAQTPPPPPAPPPPADAPKPPEPPPPFDLASRPKMKHVFKAEALYLRGEEDGGATVDRADGRHRLPGLRPGGPAARGSLQDEAARSGRREDDVSIVTAIVYKC